jgi:hypothetical protein
MAHAVEELAKLLQPGDVLLTLGAGDGYRVGEMIRELFKSQESGVEGTGVDILTADP